MSGPRRRIGIALAPGAASGLRLNPRVSAVDPANTTHAYSGDAPTKFRIYPERLDEAVTVARSYDLTIDTAHFHVAHELRNGDLARFEQAVVAVADMVRRLIDLGCPVGEVIAGGGLCAPTVSDGERFDLAAHAALLARHVGPLGVTIAVEPGEYFSADAGVLLSEVVNVEGRSAAGDGSAVFADLDCGWNAMNACFVYHESVGVVLCPAADATRAATYTLAGHINEGPDLFAEDSPLPEVREGDTVALLGVGAYCQPTWHTHCLRPFPAVVWFDDRL